MENSELRRWRSRHPFEATGETALQRTTVPAGSLLTDVQGPLFKALHQGEPVPLLTEQPVRFGLGGRRLVTTWAEFREVGECELTVEPGPAPHLR